MEKDRCARLEIPFAKPEPPTSAGDAFFRNARCVSWSPIAPPVGDLRDRARLLLARIDAKLELDELRRPYLPRPLSCVRKEVICALLQAGYRVRPIARLFRVSDTVVSKCASQLRYAELQRS